MHWLCFMVTHGDRFGSMSSSDVLSIFIVKKCKKKRVKIKERFYCSLCGWLSRVGGSVAQFELIQSHSGFFSLLFLRRTKSWSLGFWQSNITGYLRFSKNHCQRFITDKAQVYSCFIRGVTHLDFSTSKDSRVQDGTVSAFSVTGYSLPQQNKAGSWST